MSESFISNFLDNYFEFEHILLAHDFVRIIDGDAFHYLDSSDRMVTFLVDAKILLVKLSDPKNESRLFSRPNKLNNYLDKLSVYEALNS